MIEDDSSWLKLIEDDRPWLNMIEHDWRSLKMIEDNWRLNLCYQYPHPLPTILRTSASVCSLWRGTGDPQSCKNGRLCGCHWCQGLDSACLCIVHSRSQDWACKRFEDKIQETKKIPKKVQKFSLKQFFLRVLPAATHLSWFRHPSWQHPISIHFSFQLQALRFLGILQWNIVKHDWPYVQEQDAKDARALERRNI